MRITAVKSDLETAPFPDLVTVLDYWRSKRGDRVAPTRGEISPADIPPHILPQMMVIDVVRDPLDFRYRLWGTGIVELHGIDLTGNSVRDLHPPEYADLIWQQYLEVVERREPRIHVNQVPVKAGMWARQAVLRLPLSSDGETIDMVISVDSYDGDTDALGKFFASDTEDRRSLAV